MLKVLQIQSAKEGRRNSLTDGTFLTLTLVDSFEILKKLQFDVIKLWMLERSSLSFKFKVKFKHDLNLGNY